MRIEADKIILKKHLEMEKKNPFSVYELLMT